MYEILLILLGYLYGSIPFALVIGKVFYNTDVRESGSGNLGGTNAGRVLGKKAGISVIVLDALKAVIIFYLSSYLSLKFNLNPDIKYLAGLACIFGHCYPIFAEFRGGKAVSTSLGYFLCIEPLYAVVAIVVFLLVLKISKYVSLSSISTALIVLCITPFLAVSITAKLCMLVAVILLVYRHKDNIKRIKNHTESKIQWM
ncbi:glycerol-3-phosphate 1-O-acyltransferase PlsY [Faecalibacillus intestinalis]|mgnify:FL=1|jgi:glycerol-3-phosphate acyltransferase PlsY|uniref:glycerol-3-phosphate 1-O-acyltransferase PlsY n=1 Tax=Faecalibacillus intestinalis TaxID=1982626 RepID=UPI0022DFFA95|nr:glycerol-3-phosphate 1-O-acyltransferase PlsY [Faecalibacillus intestinalis]